MHTSNIQGIISFFLSMCLANLLMAQTITNYTTADGLISNNTNAIAFDAKGDMWVATQNGISQYDGTNWSSYSMATHPGLLDDGVVAVAVMADSSLWFGTDFGISTFDGSNWVNYTSADGLGSERIKFIVQGPNGKVWVGENNGLSVFDGSSWTAYGTSSGLPFGGVNHVAFDSTGNTGLGTGLGGIRIFDGTNFTAITESDGLQDDKVRAIAVDAQNNKWIGTAAGISVFDVNNQFVINHTRPFILPPPDTLNPIEDVQIDQNGQVWASVYVDYLFTEGGVSVYDGMNWRDYDVADGLVGPATRRMAIDQNNDVWVATSTGISQFQGTAMSLDNRFEPAFKIYPNPATDILSLSWETGATHPQKLEVFNLKMQPVLSKEVKAGATSSSLATQSLAPGIYLIKLGSQVSRFVVK